MYIETLFEQKLRHPTSDLRFDEGQLRASSSKGFLPPRLKSQITFGPQCLAKFGKWQHMISALKQGRIRVAPASAYNDPSLNAAQKDEELQHHVRTPNERIDMKLYGRYAPDGEEVEITPQWGELIRYMQVTNFFVWCCGLGYDSRLFGEFQAEAALIVLDQSDFVDRFARAVANQKPNVRFEHRGIGYYDPYTTRRDQLTPAFSKNLKYLYQNEYRFVWWMPEGETFDPFFVELGSIEDIATIVELA
ncbi:hypothetical protein CN311_03700 [Mesorhizobium sanjuanii]|uniref:Uncharacterized protein n=1 Tax=Mesorhizobium sanjuanii TaxID=2037900 RepID=A0A2A6FL60_9HYPH|nr:hypothetical protein CN311_03700 [Mesorhizobium sanjuanii]